MISIIADVLIAAVMVFTIVMAAKKGLIKSVTGLIKGAVSFIAAYAFTPMLSGLIYDKFMLGRISGGIEKTLLSLSGDGSGTYDLAGMFDKMDSSLKQIIDRYGADASEVGELCKSSAASKSSVEGLADIIAHPVADMISSALAFIGIFVAVFLALTILAFILDAIFHLPVLKSTNKFLGFVFGIAEALILAVFISSAVAALVRGLGSVNSDLFGDKVVESSYLLKFFSTVDLFGLVGTVVK